MFIGKCMTASAVILMAFCIGEVTTAQSIVSAGEGSYASAPPYYKAKTTPNGAGFNATAMLSREIFADELPSQNNGSIDIPGRPIPTNDWWTDVINNRFSGALWSYPAMLHTSEAGVTIYWPTYWADAGKEIKSKTNLTVSALRYRAQAAIATDWHDWGVVFRMPGSNVDGEMTVTSVHGSPFTWFEYADIDPVVNVGADATLFGTTDSYTGVKIGDDLYGIYFPKSAGCKLGNGSITFDNEAAWLSVGLLRSEADLTAFAPYATSIPRDTRVEWNYDEAQAKVNTTWTVEAVNLRDPSDSAPVLQGFLPHAYKYALPGANLPFIDTDGFRTPRGIMKLAASPAGQFGYSYQFSGMLPSYGAPLAGNSDTNGFRSDVLDELMATYASRGTYGADTYWGGKGLVQMAMNMSFAKQAGNTAVYEESLSSLRAAFEDWLTYSPGESHTFFSYYPRWGAMLGFDVSYDSDAFNDHHFHYGYFTYAAALLCMEDKDFADKYRDLLIMIAKDYANWDREDQRFPFMRTLDPWCGHSWAGGLGDPGNDNGNGQESTSEAMQSWGGLYLLGVALGDKEMRDAGIWGWNTEARATREYWYDVDAPRPANEGGRKPWPGKGERIGNYDYNEYPYAYNSNITGKGIGWWTWFGGDPLFMHGIQWMPISPALDYLSWDPDFVAWAYDDMMSGANSSYSHDWFEYTVNTWDESSIEPLAMNDWGNVTLAYLQRANPQEAARIFDEAMEKQMHIATSVSTSHISYYITHSHLTYGEPDFTIHADIPTAQVQVKDGVATYFVYNPDDEDRTVNFYDANGALVKTVIAPANKMVGISADPVATSIEVNLEEGNILPPGASTAMTWRVLDQYGAGLPGAVVTPSLVAGTKATVEGNTLKIADNATIGSKFEITLTHGDIAETVEITVNNRPVAQSGRLDGVASICEKNVPMDVHFIVTDQYSEESEPEDTRWTLTSANGKVTNVKTPLTVANAGKYTLTATSASAGKSASAEIFITPPMPVISLEAEVAASSAENVGCLPAGAVDGQDNTRWGSAHTDDEWLVVDLGSESLISRIDINWEAAYGALYDLQVAPDGAELETITVNYAGANTQVTVPVESAWTTAVTETASGGGHRETIVNSRGRYVRLKCIERGLPYGYSCFQFTVYGMSDAQAADAIIGVEFDLPEVMDVDQTVTLKPIVYRANGTIAEGYTVEWSADKDAKFEGTEFTPLASGVCNVTATIPGVGSSQCSTFVNDVERPTTISLDRTDYQSLEMMPVKISYKVMNQFLAPYKGNFENFRVTVLSDNIPTNYASYDVETQEFVGKREGTYVVDFNGMVQATVEVRKIEGTNLALGKTAWASSYENVGLVADYAVDGSYDTRWGSTFNDDEWMIVDLGGNFVLDNIKIFWNTPAYATHYTVATSMTGYDDEFEPMAVREDFVHAGEAEVFTAQKSTVRRLAADDPGETPVIARYVRVQGHKRATVYGTSIDELEVYGSASADEITALDTVSAGADDSTERWYNLQGYPVARPTAPGFYICVKGSTSRKILVK